MTIKNAILICFLSFATTNLFSNSLNHIQPLSHTSAVDSTNHGKKLVFNAVRVSDIGNCSNLLEWIMPNEKNSYSFVVMKSSDKINYTSIGSVLGGGTTNESKLYEFVDQHASPNNYYRIDQFDFKGQMLSSEILMMTSSCANDATPIIIEKIASNPLIQNELSIHVFNNVAKQEKVMLTDMYGKVIMTKNMNLKQGKNILRLNVAKIPTGTFFIKVGSASEKFKR